MKYKKWLKREVDKGHSISDIEPTLELFCKYSHKLKNKDIYTWDAKELEEHFKTLDLESSNEKRLKGRGKFLIISKNKDYSLLRVDDVNASKFWGTGTKWCISGKGDYFNSYRDNGAVFYFLIDRKKKNKDANSKFAISIVGTQYEIYNASDTLIVYNSLPVDIRKFLGKAFK